MSRLHLRIGWWALLVFLGLGIGLELLHGLKLGWYLDPSNETRRLMWTLAHSHGGLLAVLHIVFAGSLRLLPAWTGPSRSLASRSLTGALILMPLGFWLGGLHIHGGDPGLGILLVPPGGALLLFAVFLTARAADAQVAVRTGEVPHRTLGGDPRPREADRRSTV